MEGDGTKVINKEINEIIIKARQADIVSYLISRGEQVKKVGKEFVWKTDFGKICIRGCLWFDHYEGIGGNSIDFVMKYFGINFFEAVNELTGEFEHIKHKEKPKIEFVLPEANVNTDRVFIYLTKQRKIESTIISTFIYKNLIYESKKYHNAVFVGYDKNKIPRHAHLRSTSKYSDFKINQEGSDPNFPFSWHGSSDTAFLFEAPIDLLSYITMNSENWKTHTYLASCGVSERPLMQCLIDYPNIKNINLCFDNDKAGRKATIQIEKDLFLKGYSPTILIPKNKDWNEDLSLLQEEK